MKHIFLFEDDESQDEYRSVIGESFSSHRAVCGHEISGKDLIHALRVMADKIEETNEHYKGIPD